MRIVNRHGAGVRAVRVVVCAVLVCAFVPIGVGAGEVAGAPAQGIKQQRLALALSRSLDGGSLVALEAPDFASAVPTTAGLTNGNLGAEDGYDVYSVVLAADERVSVELDAASTTNFDLYVYRETHSLGVVGSSLLDAYPERIVHDVRSPDAGTYYIVVERFSGSGDYTLDIAIDPAPMVGAINAIPGVPLVMPSVGGQLDRGTEPDHVYAVDLVPGERLSLVLSMVGGDADVFVFGPAATDVSVDRPLAGAATAFDPEILAFDVPAGTGGTYYVNVWAAAGSPTYELAAAVGLTPPLDADAEIPGAALGASPRVDTLAGSGDSLVYALPAADVGDRIAISLAGTDGTDFDVRLFAPGATSVLSATPIARSELPVYPDELSYTVPAGGAGVYYVHVRSYRGSGAFALSWSVGPRSHASISRLYGDHRYLTAVDISSKTFAAGSCDTVVLATGADYPDALTASGLAGAYRSPVLLTPRNTLSTPALNEIKRLGATEVLVVGGPVAVSVQVTSALTQAGLSWRRVYGPDRFATAVAVAAESISELARTGRPWDGTVFVARSDGFADALAAAPLAYGQGVPILLTRPGSLSSVTAAALADLGADDVMVVGGEGAISSAVFSAIGQVPGVLRTDRVWGATRYQTASALAEYALKFHWADTGVVGVATGRDFADALSGGAAAGAGGGVLILTTTSYLAQPSADFLNARSGTIDRVQVYGGPVAVSADVIAEISTIAP